MLMRIMMSNAVTWTLLGVAIASGSSQAQAAYTSQLHEEVNNVYPKYADYVDLSGYGSTNGLVDKNDLIGSCGCSSEIARVENKLQNVLHQLQSRKSGNLANYYGSPPPAAIVDYASAYEPQYDFGYGSKAIGDTQKKRDNESGRYQNARGDETYGKRTNNERLNEAAYEKFSAENNNDGHSKQVGYAGASEYGDAQAVEEGYTKNEDYNNGAFNTEDAARFEAGVKDNQGLSAKVRKESQNRIDFEQNLADNFNYEQHNGNYKGNEFDVKYSATDQQGGYKEYENEREYDAEKSDGFEGKSSLTKQGDYQGSDYLKGSDYSKEGDLSTRRSGTGEYAGDFAAKHGDINGMGKQSRDLYNAYKGSEPRNKRPRQSKGNNPNNNFFKEEEEEYSQDANEREYGAAFEGKDGMEQSYNNAGYANFQQGDRSKSAYDNGNYRDVQANGHNKHADYQGDYNTINTEHNTAYGLRDDREYKQDVDTDFQQDRYTETYADGSAKGTFAKENNKGKYYDREDYSEFDANAHGKAYEADSYSNGRKSNGYVDNTVNKYIEQDKSQTKTNGQDDTATHYNRYGKGYYQK